MSTSTTPPRRPAQLDTLDLALVACEEFGRWWKTARWPARVLAASGLTVASSVVLLVVWTVLQGLSWIADGLVQLLGHDGAHALATWQITHVITDPVRHYLSTAGADLPASPQTLTVGWAVAAGLLLLGSLVGIRGARIGWAVIGAATTTVVYAGTIPSGRLVAAAVTAAAWALLSIPAYWRRNPRGERAFILATETRPSDD